MKRKPLDPVECASATCDVVFVPVRRGMKFCCVACQKPRVKAGTLVCRLHDCSNRFLPSTPDNVYCSPACQRRHARRVYNEKQQRARRERSVLGRRLQHLLDAEDAGVRPVPIPRKITQGETLL